ncbi:hypothetical protein ACSBR2_032959 [Camellia fascicularis]
MNYTLVQILDFLNRKSQIEQGILDFSEGLRVIGVKPNKKLARFADNSCWWLIADTGFNGPTVERKGIRR